MQLLVLGPDLRRLAEALLGPAGSRGAWPVSFRDLVDDPGQLLLEDLVRAGGRAALGAEQDHLPGRLVLPGLEQVGAEPAEDLDRRVPPGTQLGLVGLDRGEVQVHALAGDLLQGHGRLDLDVLREQAEPRHGVVAQVGVVPAVLVDEPLGLEHHPAVGVEGDDRVLDRIGEEPLLDLGPVLADDLAVAEPVRVVLGDLQPGVGLADDGQVAGPGVGVPPGQLDEHVQQHRVGHAVRVAGVPPGRAGRLLAAFAQMPVDDPEVERDVEEDQAGPRVGQEERTELVGVDQAVGRAAGAGRGQGQPGDRPVVADHLGLGVEGQIAPVRERPAVPGLLVGELPVADDDDLG